MPSERTRWKEGLPLNPLCSGDEESFSVPFNAGTENDVSQTSLTWRSHLSQKATDETREKTSESGNHAAGALVFDGHHGQHRHAHTQAKIPSPVAVPPSSFYDPYNWLKTYQQLYRDAFPPSAWIAISHKKRATLNTKSTIRAACYVRVLPQLDVIKAALKTPAANQRRELYEIWESASAYGADSHNGIGTRRRGSPSDEASMAYIPTPLIWAAISKPEGHEINVYDAFTGACLLRISEPKGQLTATSLLHAPFRGFMDRQLKVISIHKPKDLLRLKTHQLIETDYVWVGFTDGSIRLFPANPNRIRNTDRSEQMAKAELEDVVFELPKYHNASIIAISRSPCHEDDKGMDLSTMNRLSAAIEYMTAASTKGSEDSREHLSLMCTASVDSSIVVWDVRKIYQTLEAMRNQKRGNALKGQNSHGARWGGYKDAHSGGLDSVFYPDSASSDVVTIDGYASDHKKIFSVRSTCTMIKVRPVLKLKGGVTALKSIQWVSTLVTTEGYQVHRRVAETTRDAEERSAPKFVKKCHDIQIVTRFQRREEHRRVLGLNEEEMREIEEELKSLMPTLSPEPVQSLRINLIIAGDSVGSIHLWNLDEELHYKQMQDPFDCGVGIQRYDISPKRNGSPAGTIHDGGSVSMRNASESPGRTSLGSLQMRYSTASPSIQMSAIGGASKVARRAKLPGKAPKIAPKRATSTATVPLLSVPSKGYALPVEPMRASAATRGKGVKSSLQTKPKLGLAADRATSVRTTNRALPSATASVARPSGRLQDGKGHAKVGVKPQTPTAAAQESLQARFSKLQKLATIQRDAHVSLREMNAIMCSNELSLAASNNPGEPSNPKAKRRSNVISKISTPVRPTESTRPRASQSQIKANVEKRKTVSVSLSCRKGGAPQATEHAAQPHTHTKGKLPNSVRTPKGKDNTSPRLVTRNDILSRASKCRIEFTGGVAITGMAVDIPHTIRTTLRQCPNPEERPFSLLEEPSPEEVEQRKLENTFEDLTEHKALFFVFQKLQLYVAVEGVVLNLECTPSWHENAEGYNYFKKLKELDQGDAMSSLLASTRMEEMPVVGEVEFPCFNVQLRKRTLEAHSQPVIQLFLDNTRGLIWVARNDGLLSLFSKDTKQIVTRVAHPCADAALGPPPLAEWKKQQQAYLRETKLGNSNLHLEWHEETKGYEPAHFNSFLPFCKRSQTTLILLSSRQQARMEAFMFGELHSLWYEAEKYANSFGLAKSYDLCNHSEHSSSGLVFMQAQKLDGRSDMDTHACCRERCLSDLFGQFTFYRRMADKIRHAQKDNYQLQCDLISRRVRYIMQELSACTSFSTLSLCYDIWKRHAQHYRHEHTLRRQRASRIRQLDPLVNVALRNTTITQQGRCFYMWFRWYARRVKSHRENVQQKFLFYLMAPTRRLPTGNMMHRLWEKHVRAQVYKFWKSLAGATGPRHRGGHFTSKTSLQTISSNASPIALFKSVPQDCDNMVNITPLMRTETCTYLAGPEPQASGYIGNISEYPTKTSMSYRNGDDALNKQDKLMSVPDYTSSTAYIHQFNHEKENIASTGALNEFHSEDLSLVSTFLEIMALLFDARHAMMQFKESNTCPQSVLDESWLSIVESSEEGANVDDEDGRRLAVFSYALLPLLQGLVSTASDVLANLNDPSVAKEVVSLMSGILLCMDYVTADSVDYLESLLEQENAVRSDLCTVLFTADNINIIPTVDDDNKHRKHSANETGYALKNTRLQNIEKPPGKVNTSELGRHATLRANSEFEKNMNPLFMSPSSVFVSIMRFFALKVMKDQECLDALREVTREKESLEAFVTFIEDENSVERRCPLFT